MATVESPDFGLLLRRYRQAAGLTQEELAEQAHLSPRAISDLERGARRTPRRDTVALLAAALGLAPADRAVLEAAATRRRGPFPPRRQPVAVPSAMPGAPLPIPPTPLVGRAAQVADVVERLESTAVRLLTLTGPGGVGKTRMALEVAAALQASIADGVIFVPLASLGDPALLLATIGQALGLREAGEQPLSERLTAYLRSRDILLVLDNCEHLLAAAPQVAELLAACPSLTVLATSRAPLHLRGESEVPVPPLALPDPAWPLEAEVLAQSPAVQLFVQRAQDSVPDFRLTAANATTVAAICMRLDGLPLALELAAARLKLLPPQALLERLEHRLQLLTVGARDLPARQQTMRSAIAWSYDLLHSGEQVLFRRLAVFAGGGTLEAIEAVCRVGDDLAGDLLEWLASLVDKSLLRMNEQADGQPRFGMLETIREFAHERLAASGEEDRYRQAHAHCYLALAEQAAPQLTGPQQIAWFERLEREHDNLRAALAWAYRRGDVETGLRVAAALGRFWEVRGHGREGRRWLDDLLAYDESTTLTATALVRGRALNEALNLAYRQSDFERTIALCTESAAIHRRAGHTPGLAVAIHYLGSVAYRRGEYERAATYYAESLALRREAGDERGIARSLHDLGNVAMSRGDYARAVSLHEEGLALYRRVGDEWGSSSSLLNLGGAAAYQGDDTRAAALWEESLSLNRKLGDQRHIALLLCNLGDLALRHGQHERAEMFLRDSLALYSVAGDKVVVVACLEGLAATSHALNQPDRAARLFGAAAALRDLLGTPLSPAERPAQERLVAAVQNDLGDEEWTAAWAAGRALPLDQVIAEVLRAPEPQSEGAPA